MSVDFLEQEPDALERYLLDHARRDVAPEAARARAYVTVALVSAAVVAPSAVAHSAASSTASKLAAVLALKWGAAGLVAGLLVLGASLAVQDVVSAPGAQNDSFPRRATQSSSPGTAPAAAASAGAADFPSPGPIASEDLPEPPRRVVEGAAQAPDVSLLDWKSPLAPPAPGASPAQGLPASGSFAAIDSSRLARELQLLEQARVALARSSPAVALRVLDFHDREFASGALQAEAAALRVEAATENGQRALAQLLAQRFLAHYPQSPLSARVRALSDGAGRTANKP
jgi:hypothetical protein